MFQHPSAQAFRPVLPARKRHRDLKWRSSPWIRLFDREPIEKASVRDGREHIVSREGYARRLLQAGEVTRRLLVLIELIRAPLVKVLLTCCRCQRERHLRRR